MMRNLVTLLTTLLIAAPLAGAHATGELLKNGSFELDSDADGVPDDWGYGTGSWTSTAPGCTIARSTDARHGQHSLQLSMTGGGNCFAQSAAMPAFPGRTYSVTVATKQVEGNVLCVMTLRFFDANGDMLTPSSSGTTPTYGTWETGHHVGVAPAGAVTARLFLYGAAGAGGGTILFDAASVLGA